MVRSSALVRVLLGVMLSSASICAQDQPGSIRGSVRDKDFDAPLPGAQVTIIETGDSATTTSDGLFSFLQVAPGKYTLVFSKDGFVKQVRPDVVVASGQLSELAIDMAGDVTDVDEYVVQDLLLLGGGTEAGLLQLRFESPALLDSISADLMSRAGASDAAAALRLVAGASVQDGKTAVIRGLPDRYVSSQMNSVRLPSADEDKRAVELDQFPSAVIESIQVSKTFTPDQQGDASGGAVNVQLKGIPDEDLFFKVRLTPSYNSQVTGKSDFLSYDGGGVKHWGRDGGGRRIQYENLGGNWEGAVGTNDEQAPLLDYKWGVDAGGRIDLGNGVKLGGFGTFFYERDSAYFDNGVDNQYWVEQPGALMTPKIVQGQVRDKSARTSLYDIAQGSQLVQWGTLATFGVEFGQHSIGMTYLYTRTAEDTATLAEDTRGKEYYYPGHDPDDPDSPGHGDDERDQAPYTRLETLEYTERTTRTLQLHGKHRFDVELAMFHAIDFDWTLSRNAADLYQPDKRQFGEVWFPLRKVGNITIPPIHAPYKSAANFTLGNLQRIWKTIEEDSEQISANVAFPFEQWNEDAGYLKFGYFRDRVDRSFDQDTFSNFGDNQSYNGPWRERWSGVFRFQDHPVTASTYDVDYRGDQQITAYYGMLDLPLTSRLSLIGGARFEDTNISIVNDPEEDATWFPPGSLVQTKLNPGDADVDFSQDDVLPSIGLVYRPVDQITLRASYNETVARQTFKELTPILQQEYLGGPIFIGNPGLRMSSLRNFDLRADWTPEPGTLLSATWFRKDVDDAIEYVQRIGATFDFTTAVNYPDGRLTGWEFELRQALGNFWEQLDGLSIGANATLIDSEVTLPADEAAGFDAPNIRAPMQSRDMTNAPEHLYNLYLTYDIAATRTQFAVFYTVQGDTLIAGATQSKGNFVPNVYAREYETLNFSLTQALSDNVELGFQIKNLTNPEIETVYRSVYIGDDVLKTSYTKGIEYTFGISGEFRF